MKGRLLIILAVLTLIACENTVQDNTQNKNIISTEEAGNQVFTAEEIGAQVFSISSNIDTTLTGKDGTVLTIFKNSFIDTNGRPISGEVTIELKECLDKLDMVLSNLTTTSNGQFLESGGMIYINATSDNQQLEIAPNKTIGVEVPTDNVLNDMQIYEGNLADNSVNWINPSPINVENEQEFLEPGFDSMLVSFIQDTVYKSHNVAYNVDGFSDVGKHDEIPTELSSKIGKQIYAGMGMILTKDSLMIVDGYKVNLFKHDPLTQWEDYIYGEKWVEIGAVNNFVEDQSTTYIFSLKKLGWANIDRLFSDPRTQEIDLIVSVKEFDVYDNIYTSMIFKNQDMYLPGYQKKDKTFSFTHGDYEKTSLPIGETATILITAYKDSKPFYSIKTFEIKKSQNIDLTLKVTTKEDLKKELEKML
ncbi:MAG: hypothetical protein GQ574_07295 [Crocinitomix sp.]|nr:hypothetical protein [Crocinitomix sp.]